MNTPEAGSSAARRLSTQTKAISCLMNPPLPCATGHKDVGAQPLPPQESSPLPDNVRPIALDFHVAKTYNSSWSLSLSGC